MRALLKALFITAIGIMAPLSLAQDAPETPPVHGVNVIAAYPHDSGAFTQGLLFHNGHLYESTGMYGQSSVRKTDLTTGQVLRRFDMADQYFGEGLVSWQNRLIALTWRAQKAFVLDKEDFTPVDEFEYPGEGWGITNSDTHLYMSDGTHEIRVLNPETFEEERRIAVTYAGDPLGYLNELEWVKGEIYANVWQTEFIARIDPETGVVKGLISLRGLKAHSGAPDNNDAVLNGIAYDAAEDRLFVTGKNWARLFEIEVLAPAGGE